MGRACAAAVETQIAYAGRRGVPWGMSESGYYRFDAHRNYQYRAFGVPDLGFKRGLEDDVVVAPYASLLALPFAPPAVMANLDRLERPRTHGALRSLRGGRLHGVASCRRDDARRSSARSWRTTRG